MGFSYSCLKTNIELFSKDSNYAETSFTLEYECETPELSFFIQVAKEFVKYNGISATRAIITNEIEEYGYEKWQLNEIVQEVLDKHNVRPCEGLNVVIKGRLSEFETHEHLKSYIENRGGVVKRKITPVTDVIICNETEKYPEILCQAKAQNIPVLNEEEFIYNMVWREPGDVFDDEIGRPLHIDRLFKQYVKRLPDSELDFIGVSKSDIENGYPHEYSYPLGTLRYAEEYEVDLETDQIIRKDYYF